MKAMRLMPALLLTALLGGCAAYGYDYGGAYGYNSGYAYGGYPGYGYGGYGYGGYGYGGGYVGVAPGWGGWHDGRADHHRGDWHDGNWHQGGDAHQWNHAGGGRPGGFAGRSATAPHANSVARGGGGEHGGGGRGGDHSHGS